VKTDYTHDLACRQVGYASDEYAIAYAYNGQGSWLRQTVDEVTTTYVNDLNAGLTQVLSDGMNQYLYGNGRIAQDDGVKMGYFLKDRRRIIPKGCFAVAPRCPIP
jgi:hypothetical protein